MHLATAELKMKARGSLRRMFSQEICTAVNRFDERRADVAPSAEIRYRKNQKCPIG
jgi:hypothetical protein